MTFRSPGPNPVFSDEYRALLAVIVEARHEAGLTQRGLATRLGKAHSHVAMIERGQRRVDSLELYRMAKIFGVEPSRLFGRIARRVEAAEAAKDSAAARTHRAA